MDVTRLWPYIISMLLAVGGGIVRLLGMIGAKDVSKLNKVIIFSELFVSGFAGVISLFIARAIGLSEDWICVICGMGGWAGPKALDAFWALVAKIIGARKDISDSKDDSKKD